jgi:hypothetical protein
MFITGVNDTREKLLSSVNDTGEKLILVTDFQCEGPSNDNIGGRGRLRRPEIV